MAKPILFETISRIKYEALDAVKKLKNNYLIKEDDGTITKHIGGLEASGGGGDNSFIITATMDEHTETITNIANSYDEIEQAAKAGKNLVLKIEMPWTTGGDPNQYRRTTTVQFVTLEWDDTNDELDSFGFYWSRGAGDGINHFELGWIKYEESWYFDRLYYHINAENE